MNECKNLSKPRRDIYYFILGYEVITMTIVLVITKEKSLGTNFNQENWMLVSWLKNMYSLCSDRFVDSSKAHGSKQHPLQPTYYLKNLGQNLVSRSTTQQVQVKITLRPYKESTEINSAENFPCKPIWSTIQSGFFTLTKVDLTKF